MRIQQTLIFPLIFSFFFVNGLEATTLKAEFLYPTNEITDFTSDCPETKEYCIGIISFKDGSVYNGEISYGLPNGKGIMKWADGSYYIGSFVKGERKGVGEFHFRNGNHYSGEWANNEMNGQGIYIWANGTEYIGHFKDGNMHGTGSVVLNNNEGYSGEWSNNLPNGQGRFTQNNGSIYKGNVKDGLRDGEGKIIWENGDTISGNWASGKFDGEINFLYHNGDQLSTEWKEGQITANSSYRTKKGKVIAGGLRDIEDFLLFEDIDNSLASNMQFTYYSIGLEFGTNFQYEQASQYLQMAYNISAEESPLNETINENLSQFKERQKAGWAKLNEKED